MTRAKLAAAASLLVGAAIERSASALPSAIAPGGGSDTLGVEAAVRFVPDLVEIDYAHRFVGAFGGRGATLFNAIGTPAGTTFDAATWKHNVSHEWQNTIGLAVPLFVGARRWNIVASGFGSLTSEATSLGTALGIGLDLHAVAGYFAPKWLVGADLGVRLEPWTYLQQSSVVFDHFRHRYPAGVKGFEGPQNGFYVFPVTPQIELGAAAERRFGPFVIAGGLGYLSHALVPAYVRLGLRWEFL